MDKEPKKPKKDMRKRTFSLPKDLDLAVRRRAIDEDKEFSKIVEAALYRYMGIKPEQQEVKRPKKINK